MTAVLWDVLLVVLLIAVVGGGVLLAAVLWTSAADLPDEKEHQ